MPDLWELRQINIYYPHRLAIRKRPDSSGPLRIIFYVFLEKSRIRDYYGEGKNFNQEGDSDGKVKTKAVFGNENIQQRTVS